MLLTLDYESYYDSKFSLRRLNYTDYVRDPQFKLFGVGVKIDESPAFWLLAHQIKPFFDQLPWDEITLIAHNMYYDGLVTTERLGYIPARYVDTMAMSRLLHQGAINNDLDTLMRHYNLGCKGQELKELAGVTDPTPEQLDSLGDYCINDTWGAYGIYQAMVYQVPPIELDLIDITARMFCEPVLNVNQATINEALTESKKYTDDLVTKTGYTRKIIGSNEQFANLLREHGVEPPMKTSPTTGRPAYAFAKSDLEFLDLLAHESEAVRDLVAARQAVKSTIMESRAKRLAKAGEPPYKLPIGLLHSGAKNTLRWSGTNKMNPQNLKRKSKLRAAIEAPDGQVINVADSAQIEARTLAELAGQNDLVEAFRQGRDTYSEFASDIFGRKVDRKYEDENGECPDYLEGFIGKVSILGLGFGMGPPTFQRQLAVGMMGGPRVFFELERCTSIVQLFRTRNYKIPELWRLAEDLLGVMCHGGQADYKFLHFEDQRVFHPNGTYLYYPHLAMDHNGNYSYWSGDFRTNIYGGKFVENIVQWLARIIVAEQMHEIAQHYRVVMMTHDEVATITPEETADQAQDHMIEIMSVPPIWMPNLPVAAEGGWAKEYSK